MSFSRGKFNSSRPLVFVKLNVMSVLSFSCYYTQNLGRVAASHNMMRGELSLVGDIFPDKLHANVVIGCYLEGNVIKLKIKLTSQAARSCWIWFQCPIADYNKEYITCKNKNSQITSDAQTYFLIYTKRKATIINYMLKFHIMSKHSSIGIIYFLKTKAFV